MKKSYLWTGVGMIGLGLCCLLAALLLDTPLDSVLCGLFGALTAPGIVQIYKYFMWGRSPEYRAKLEEEQIDLRDERKEMLRNKSGRIAYVIGLLAAAVSMTAFSVLGTLGIVSEAASRLMILFLAGYMLFQLAAGWIVYRLLARKY